MTFNFSWERNVIEWVTDSFQSTRCWWFLLIFFFQMCSVVRAREEHMGRAALSGYYNALCHYELQPGNVYGPGSDTKRYECLLYLTWDIWSIFHCFSSLLLLKMFTRHCSKVLKSVMDNLTNNWQPYCKSMHKRLQRKFAKHSKNVMINKSIVYFF